MYMYSCPQQPPLSKQLKELSKLAETEINGFHFIDYFIQTIHKILEYARPIS